MRFYWIIIGFKYPGLACNFDQFIFLSAIELNMSTLKTSEVRISIHFRSIPLKEITVRKFNFNMFWFWILVKITYQSVGHRPQVMAVSSSESLEDALLVKMCINWENLKITVTFHFVDSLLNTRLGIFKILNIDWAKIAPTLLRDNLRHAWHEKSTLQMILSNSSK